MLLRGSGQHTGDDYDLTAIVEDSVTDGGVAAGVALVAYADAFFEGGKGQRDRRLTERREEVTGWRGSQAQGRSLTTRKPTLMSENPTRVLTRLAGRLALGRLSQEPPRIMRCLHAASGSTAEPSDGAPS